MAACFAPSTAENSHVKYQRILARFYAEVMAILPDKYEAIRAFLEAKAQDRFDCPQENV